MTEIIYEKGGQNTELTLFGHCNAGRVNGMDLCCCGVSMLVFTMLKSLKELGLKDFRHSYGGGWCHIRFKNKGKNFVKAKWVMDTIMNGFELLEQKYPSNVKIITKESEVCVI